MGRRRSLFGRLARLFGFVALAFFSAFVGLIALYAVAQPVSTLMIARKIEGKSYERIYVKLDDVSSAAVGAVVASEDSTFCQNDGVDWGSLNEVLDRIGKRGPRRGASTITMQTAKNLFLWPQRSAVRKGIEIGMALVLGKVWSKRRTLEIYLNVAEWGDGIFGIEAAARHYFHKRASQLDAREGALLATSLPNPIKRNAGHPTPLQQRLSVGVGARILTDPQLLTNCLAQ
jgi:monofunctional biosynthetic peptidoglycan transglycosylase